MEAFIQKFITKLKSIISYPRSRSNRNSILDQSNHGLANFLTTNDSTASIPTTAYTFRLDWGWNVCPEAELEFHSLTDAVTNQREFDGALGQDRRRVGRRRKRLRKKIGGVVHVGF